MTYPAGLFFSRLTKPRGPAPPCTSGAPVPYLPSLGSFQPVSSSVSAGPELHLGSLTAWGALDFACAVVDLHMVPSNLFLWLVEVLLNANPALQCGSRSSGVGVTGGRAVSQHPGPYGSAVGNILP